jgi:hypothetical protein
VKRWEWCELIKHSRLSANGRRMALFLSTYANDAGQCFPSIDTLAEVAAVSRSTAKRGLKELARTGYIYRLKRPFDSTFYTLRRPRWMDRGSWMDP